MVHYHHHTTIGDGGKRFTMATEIINGILYAGISVCAKPDTYSKKKGREIALGRLKKGIAREDRLSLPRMIPTDPWFITTINIANVLTYIHDRVNHRAKQLN